MTLFADLSTDLAPPEPTPSPTATTPADIASGTAYGLDTSTIAIVVLAILAVVAVGWVLALRRRA